MICLFSWLAIWKLIGKKEKKYLTVQNKFWMAKKKFILKEKVLDNMPKSHSPNHKENENQVNYVAKSICMNRNQPLWNLNNYYCSWIQCKVRFTGIVYVMFILKHYLNTSIIQNWSFNSDTLAYIHTIT